MVSKSDQLVKVALLPAAIIALTAALFQVSASATTTFYQGYDTSASSNLGLTGTLNGTVPGTLLAQSTYTSAVASQKLGPLFSYDFQNLAPSTTATGGNVKATGIVSGDGEINIAFAGDNFANLYSGTLNTLTGVPGNGISASDLPENNGFSTVSASGGYVFVQGTGANDTITLTFLNAIDSFGIFLTGLGNNGRVAPVTVAFSDGTSQTITTEGSIDTTGTNGGTAYTGPSNTNAGAEFLGFTSASSAAIKTVTFTQTPGGGDRFSFDNLQYSIVPEPASTTIFLIGGGILSGLALRGRARKAMTVRD